MYVFLITFSFSIKTRAQHNTHKYSTAVACTDTAALYSVTHPITNHPWNENDNRDRSSNQTKKNLKIKKNKINAYIILKLLYTLLCIIHVYTYTHTYGHCHISSLCTCVLFLALHRHDSNITYTLTHTLCSLWGKADTGVTRGFTSLSFLHLSRTSRPTASAAVRSHFPPVNRWRSIDFSKSVWILYSVRATPSHAGLLKRTGKGGLTHVIIYRGGTSKKKQQKKHKKKG